MKNIAEKFNLDSLPHSRTGIVDLDPAWLEIDAARFQFKSGGDQYGVTDRLQGVTVFDPKLSGVILAWLDLEGRLFIADGHQRLGLARRACDTGQSDDIFLPARVYKEADGFSADDVKILAAFKNIAEGTGSAVDAARLIKKYGDLPDTIPSRSVLVRQAKALAKLGEESFNAVCNGRLEPSHGAAIAMALETAKLDDARRLKTEEAIIRAFCDPRTRPANEAEAFYLAREVMRTGITETHGGTLRLFEDDVTHNILKERAEIMTAAQRMLQAELRQMKFMLREESHINNYIDGQGKIDRGGIQGRQNVLLVAKVLLDLGWKYGDVGNPLATAARRLHTAKTAPEKNLEIKTLLEMLDKSLTVSAHDLKSAKMKGDPDKSRLIKIRAVFARNFLRAAEAFLVESQLAKNLQRGLGHKTPPPKNRKLGF